MRRGFSLIEVLVTVFVAVLALMATYSAFILASQTERPITTRAEISQNQRATLDRLSRELRQANAIATTLPAAEIMFEDGHNNLAGAPIQYIRYHLINTDIYREVRYYYFTTDPNIHVFYNDKDASDNPPLTSLVEDRLVGEYISALNFSGTKTITINLTLSYNNQALTISTNVVPRNLK